MSFTQVLNLSISASWLVAAIIAVRYLLKAAPKALHCALWALVAIRLLCPVSFESGLSLIPSREVIPESYLQMEPADEGFDSPVRMEIVTNPNYEESVRIDTETTVDRVQNFDLFATVIWLAGMGAMAVYALYSYLSIRLRVRMAGWLSKNVWECDDINSPFILGLLRPRIYLPSGLDEATKAHVLAHENAHLKRLDHIWKPLGFALLAVHWFNPVMWAAYVLLCRDIELACDERVIKNLEKPAVRAYSEALVRCSVNHKMIAACPLAFGEVGVKGRIRSMLNYKKPGFWIILIAVIVSIAVAVCFLTDPVEKPDTLKHIQEEDGCTIVSQTPETTHIDIYKDFLPAKVLNGKLHTFAEDEFILYRTDTTTIYLESARLYGNELMLTLNFRYEIPESGEILLPYQIENGGRVWTAAPPEGSDARIIQYGPDPAISIGIGMEVLKEAGEYITFDLCNMNRLTYRADHLASVSTTEPQLDAIVNEDGYLITSNAEEQLGFMFYTHWLPEGFESGYSFADGELVLAETETTKLQMKYAMLDGEQYCFDFLFTYDLPESGTIYVPYFVNIKGISSSLELSEGLTYDYTKTITEGVTLTQERGTEGFSILVDKEVYEGLSDYLSVTLDGVYALTYVRSGTGLPMGQYLEVDAYEWISAVESFVITDDLRLIGCEKGTMFPIERDLGQLLPVNLEDTPAGSAIKSENQRTWRCEAFGSAHLLLQQKDGRLIVLKLTEDGTGLSDLYHLAGEGEPVPPGQDPTYHRFALANGSGFDLPTFSLCSDGTFQFTLSVLSSYLGHGSYTLSKEELILKTADGRYTWYFHVDGNSFAYDAERSSPISYMPDLKTPTPVRDGELFSTIDKVTYQPAVVEPVEELIDAAIIEDNIIDNLASVHGASHRILSELIACGVAPADGGAPIEELTICILAAYSEKSTDGKMTYIEETNVYPAKLSFRGQDGVYELTDYRELSDEEAEAEFPAFAWEDLERNRDQYRAELLAACREQENAQLAALQADMQEAARLFEIVASSPAQYSYPSAYINAHPDEWQKLLDLGAATVHYAFSQLASDEEQGVKGMLMAEAAQTIIGGWSESCTFTEYSSGQDWFSKFYQHAKAVSEARTWDSLRRDHPGCALAIIHRDYLIFPPI